MKERQKRKLHWYLVVSASIAYATGCQSTNPSHPLQQGVSKSSNEALYKRFSPQVVTPSEQLPDSVDTGKTSPSTIVNVPTEQSVEHFVAIALSEHPRIHSARAQVFAVKNLIPQASALEDPLLSNSFYPVPEQALQTAAGRAGNTLSITQKIPWPDKLWTKATIADRERQIAAKELTQVELEVEESVRLAYYELWFASRAIEITKENRQVAQMLVKLAQARNIAGGSQQDVLRAQLQLDSLDDRLISLRRQNAVAQADLAALVHLPQLTTVVPSAQIAVEYSPKPLDELLAAAKKCSPLLHKRQWAVARDRQKQHLAKLSKYPDFVLGAAWQTTSESDAVASGANGRDNISFMVGVTLPIWRDRINAAVREATAKVAISSFNLEDTYDDTIRQIRGLKERAQASYDQWQLYGNRILPRAKRTLQLAAADYRGQRVDFGEVATGFMEVLVFELQVARAKATLAGTLAQMHRAVGCDPQTEHAGHLLSSTSNAFSR